MKALTTAALIAALALAPAAMAESVYQDHAIDKSGKPIMDARGNCVYTKWEAKNDTCGAKRMLKLSREERTIYFDFNKASIKQSEKGKLSALVKAVKGAKEVESVDVVGHADMIGNSAYNQSLSRKRAEAVKAYLTRGGVKTRKVDLRALGETKSVTKCDNTLPRAELIACLAEDRRVEVELNYVK